MGAAEVAFGFKFTARCVLEICEWPDGIPQSICGASTSSSDDGTWPQGGAGGGGTWPQGGGAGGGGSAFPCPRSPLAVPHRDISFELVEGDFLAFRGLWRIQPSPLRQPAAQWQNGGGSGGDASRLSYSLLVRPHRWLPVGLIQPKVEQEVICNLEAVAAYVEANQAGLLRQYMGDGAQQP